MQPASAYRPEQFLADVRGTIFQELKMASPAIDAYRRNLQRGYVELLAARINVRGVADDNAARCSGAKLKILNEEIGARAGEAGAAGDSFASGRFTGSDWRWRWILGRRFRRELQLWRRGRVVWAI